MKNTYLVPASKKVRTSQYAPINIVPAASRHAYEQLTDAQLIDLLKSGETQAGLYLMFIRHSGWIDLCSAQFHLAPQESISEIYDKFGIDGCLFLTSCKNIATLAGFINTSVWNHCLKLIRNNNKALPTLSSISDNDSWAETKYSSTDSYSCECGNQHDKATSLVEQLINSLPSTYQQVIRWYLEGYSSKQMAQMLPLFWAQIGDTTHNITPDGPYIDNIVKRAKDKMKATARQMNIFSYSEYMAA